jgi:capping protein alpha
MADESDLSPAEKLKIASNFISSSPPGQAQKVVEDVRTLIDKSVLTSSALNSCALKVNISQFVAVRVPGTSYAVLLTPTGDLGNSCFLDPNAPQQLVIDHLRQECIETRPLEAAHKEHVGCEEKRKSVDRAMKRYTDEFISGAVVTTYGREVERRAQITCCVGRVNMNLGNFWSGLWRSEWKLVIEANGRSGRLEGRVHCDVHYFEDGNVQLHDKLKFDKSIDVQPGDEGASFVSSVSEFEQALMASMEDIYQTMSESVLNGLRRRLPITKVKFDWDNKASVHKLAADLQKQSVR